MSNVHWSNCSAHPQWGGTDSDCTCRKAGLPPSAVALIEAARRLERIADASSGDMTPQAVWGIRFAVRELREMAAGR